ncbi:MAG: flagellar brake protein [Agathobacter sp.]|nr:flagellar brake protein [Agathobacter sp.]
MILNEIINPGDKIDIQLTYQLEKNKLGETVDVKQYKSSVFDFVSDTEIEIAMPTEAGKVVLFQNGLRIRLIIYTKRGLYECFGIVKNRCKKENILSLIIEIKTSPQKFQRREFYRIECSIDMQYYSISQEVAKLETTEALFAEIQNFEYIDKEKKSIIQDISGGGIRFTSDEQLERDSFLLAIIRLTNEKIDNTFYLVCKIISSNIIEHMQDKYTNRAKFIFKDIKDRETIVRYVFEEERRIRRKEIG